MIDWEKVISFMSKKESTIVPLSPEELNTHHFGDEWKLKSTDYHHLFHINRIEDVIQKIKFPLEPHRKTVNDFIFISEGKSRRSKGLQNYEFEANTFFFLPALQISTHDYISADTKGFFCHFDTSLFKRIFPDRDFTKEFPFWQFACGPLVTINENLKQPVCNILERMLYEYETNKVLNSTIIAAYLFTLFTELNACCGSQNTNVQNAAFRITEQYKNLLEQHIFKSCKVADYASMMAITPDHLNKCVRSIVGKTAQELLADMVVLEAKVLLKQTTHSISEIAFRFAEMNPSDFTRFFRLKAGISPKEYRKREMI